MVDGDEAVVLEEEMAADPVGAEDDIDGPAAGSLMVAIDETYEPVEGGEPLQVLVVRLANNGL